MASSDGNPAARFHHHAVAVPVPGQGHKNPLMRLCKTLARRHAFTITFVNMAPLQQRIQERIGDDDGTTTPANTSSLPIRMASVSMPAADDQIKSGFRVSMVDVLSSANVGLEGALEDLIHTLSARGTPVTCLISDFLVSESTQRVADKLRLPRIVFFPSCQAFNLLLTYMCTGTFPMDDAIQAALQRDMQPHQPVVKMLRGLPGLVNRDLPTFKHMQEETDQGTRFLCHHLSIALANKHGLTNFVVNSFEGLEGPAFNAQHLLSLANPSLPRVYPVGPLLEDLSSDEATNTSLLKEDPHCLAWLDSKAPRSVLYVSFGSITLLSMTQFEEFLLGLEASGHSFLLVFRPDLVDDASYTSLPQEFLMRNKGLGYVVSWAPQLRVLSHPSIGGFLTHCGWNSTIEAIANGVPMLCWPYFGDQPLNAKYIVDEWKVGLRVEASRPDQEDAIVTRDDIELLIRTLMQSPTGEALREKAMHLSSIAVNSHLPGGPSYQNIEAVFKSFLDSTPTNAG